MHSNCYMSQMLILFTGQDVLLPSTGKTVYKFPRVYSTFVFQTKKFTLSVSPMPCEPHVIFVALGSRGDVQPLAVLATQLSTRHGGKVTLVSRLDVDFKGWSGWVMS